METAINVQLLTHTPDPVRVMYVAFRTCYSRFTPQELWADIESGKITDAKMKSFIFDKLKTGHSSPRTQVYFTFAVSGLSRSNRSRDFDTVLLGGSTGLVDDVLGFLMPIQRRDAAHDHHARSHPLRYPRGLVLGPVRSNRPIRADDDRPV